MNDHIPSIPSQHADRNSSRQRTTATDAKDILGQKHPINLSPSYSASLGYLCVFAVNSSFFANFAWVQHMLHHLPPNGSMALLLANGSMSSNSSGEGDIHPALIDADLVSK